MKKKFFLSLALLIAFVFIAASCSQTDVEEKFDVSLFDENATPDLNGFDCLIRQEYGDESVICFKRDTVIADAILKRISDINTEFNCNVHTETGNGNYLRDYITRLYAGDYVGEIAVATTPMYIASAGILYPLDGLLDYIDYYDSSKYGSAGLLELGMVDGVPYVVTPMSWAGMQMTYTYNIFAVNEMLVKKYNLNDPRDYVENGEWTFDTFYNVLPDYNIDDGDFQATAMNATWTFTMDIAFMNGFDFAKQNSDGTYSANMEDTKLVEALDWCSKLLVDRRDCITFDGHSEMVSNFINNKTVLANTSFTHLIHNISYDAEDYGVVPFPCGPSGTYGQWSGACSDFETFGIFINAKEPEMSAMILSELLEPLDGFTTEDEMRAYASTVFYDSRDVDFFLENTKYLRNNYWTYGVYDIFSNAKELCKVGKSGAEIIGKIGESTNAIIEEYILPNYDLINDLKANGK